jgi:hypothetical protein
MKTRKLWAWMVLFTASVFTLPAMTAAAQDSPPPPDQAYAQDQPGPGQTSQDQPQDQAAQDQNQDEDPPGRVGRLNFSEGSVSFRPAGENDWVTAVPNRPIVSGDDLWADENSRAEVHIGSAAIRLGAKTGITLLTLDDHTTQIRLAQGSLIVRVRHVDDDDTYEIDAPNLAFTLLQPGEYRVDVSEDGNTSTTTVWHGRGRVTGGGLSYTVVAGQAATFTGSDHLDYDLGQIPDQDGFDQWAFERDDREDHADSANYVSREMTGYEDLDEYGDWSYVAGYGPCWRPRAIVGGWAPYRYGHWAYVGPWGWTWVEDEPWGFAPFHYGRWAFVSNGWFWVPGPVVIRPVWAPALVAFVGGGGFHVGVGVSVGWFPLGPGEVFVPGYHVSRGYVNNVNITNTTVNVTKITNVYNTVVINKTTNVTNITYVNQHVNNGVTVVSHETFANARPVAQNIVKVNQREIESAPVTHVASVEPVRGSVLGAGRPVAVKPPAAVINRPVVAVKVPPAPPRSMEQRQAEAGGHLNQQALVRQAAPARPVQMNQNPSGRTQPSQDGFRPFTPPGGNNSQVRPMPNTQPRVYEQQGSSQPESRSQQPENRNSQPTNRSFSAPSNSMPREEARPTPQETHPLVKPAPPVQERNPQQEQQQEQKFHEWQQQRPAPPPPQHQQSHPAPPPPSAKPSKKGR